MLKSLVLIFFIFFLPYRAIGGDFEELIEKLRSEDNIVRLEGALNLLEMGTPIENKLIKHLNNEPEQTTIHIIWILGELGKKRYVPYIIPFIDTSHDLTRYTLVALGKIGDPDTIPLIAKKLNDKSRYIRTDAARAFGRIGDKRGIPYLIEAENDSDWHIREAVAKSLGEIGGALAMKHLKKLTESDPDGVVRAWAYDGLHAE